MTSGDAVDDSITVEVIDIAASTIIATIPAGVGGGKIGITPDGAFAYVVQDPLLNLVSVIETATNTVTATVTIGAPFAPVGSFAVAITPDGAFAYVTNIFNDTVSVVDTTTDISHALKAGAKLSTWCTSPVAARRHGHPLEYMQLCTLERLVDLSLLARKSSFDQQLAPTP